jgi:hypothetical protein
LAAQVDNHRGAIVAPCSPFADDMRKQTPLPPAYSAHPSRQLRLEVQTAESPDGSQSIDNALTTAAGNRKIVAPGCDID